MASHEEQRAVRKIRFDVVGMAPAHSKAANDLLKACDLCSGAFIARANTVTIGYDGSSDMGTISNALRMAYEAQGWIDVFVS